ncbi:MAG TPA: hypothetical protein VNJ71_13050 [Gemmatimonadales bacterium]|jgi:phosphoglycolate phosphatase-like HAD superfamily hydrolase|nr:hypothetical protein [Gemmatimonadales bacterium]
MTDKPLQQQVTELRSMLTAIDAQLGKTATPPEGLEELKRAVDTLRTNVWAILSAARSKDYQVFIERFKLRRAIDITRGLLSDIESGVTRQVLPEHSELQIILRRLNEEIGKLQRTR